MPSTTTPSPPQQQHYKPPATVLLLYPLTLVLGSLFSILSPTAQPPPHTDPFVPSLASDINLPHRAHPDTPINYFARKNNIFNLYFVKIGWLWTTIAFASLLLFHPPYNSSSPSKSRRIAQAAIRYAIATLVWYLVTQWFFGPAIIDRGFVVTGGRCERAYQHLHDGQEGGGYETGAEHLGKLFTAAACKSAGGDWRGGHDVSGHVFMLVLASAVLVLEAIGVGAPVKSGENRNEGTKEKADTNENEGSNSTDGDCLVRVWVGRSVYGIAGLAWWMLFMTAIWFHTWLEKVSYSIYLSMVAVG